MLKPVLWVFAGLIALSANAVASQFPTAHDPQSHIELDFGDLDFVLSSAVLDMGPSTHKRAWRVQRDSGTRIYGGNRKASRFEGNRVVFHLFEDEHHAGLREIRDELLAIPAGFDLQTLSRNHQLAYWLNLHNVIVLVEMADRYPFTRVEPLFNRDSDDAFINRKDIRWNGQLVSLADIQDHVLNNWRDPLVIYGFYMGAVGTPNIRQDAFKGGQVYDQLRENARNFVNSVRGTQIWNGSELRVATYYQRMAVKFPNFERDVLRHIEEYARPKFARRLTAVATVEPRIDDWNIADLYNGHLHQAGRTGPSTTMDAFGNLMGQPIVPLHVVHLMRGRANNFRRFDPQVEIEELSVGTSEPVEEETAEQQEKAEDPGSLAST